MVKFLVKLVFVVSELFVGSGEQGKSVGNRKEQNSTRLCSFKSRNFFFYWYHHNFVGKYLVLTNMKRSNLSGMFFLCHFCVELNPIYDDSGIKVLNFTIQKLDNNTQSSYFFCRGAVKRIRENFWHITVIFFW